MIGKHCIKTWCSTQGAVALSSAEAEYYSLVEGVMRGKGLQNMGKELGLRGMEEELELKVRDDLGKESSIDVFIDSSAAKGFASKRGVGKMRHMEVKWLWLQEEVRRGRVRVKKVLGTENPADLLTKYMKREDIQDRAGRMKIEVRWVERKEAKEVRGVWRRERRSSGGEQQRRR
jgi:hypothetical protein